MRSFKTGLLVALLSLALASPAAAYSFDPYMDSEERAMCAAINEYREQNGVPPLRLSVALARSSGWMSADMARKSYFSHIDSFGRQFHSRMTSFGYTYSTGRAETIAAGLSTGVGTFEQWRDSTAHNYAMLNPAYTVFGVGRKFDALSPYRWYWTADFGGHADRTMDC